MLAPEHVARPSRPQIALGIASDERLTTLAAAGSERAVEVIYGRYHQRIYRYCRTLVSDDADAQDALQSTFTAALSSFQTSGPPQAPLRPWLFRIAHNESISILRRGQRRATDPLDDSLAATGDPASELAKRDAFATLVADLRQLPERQRGALVMRELSGLSHEEIGVALGTSTATAKQTIFEARRSLMELAAGRELDCETIRALISDTDADGRTMRSRRVRGHLSACTACTAFADQLRSRRDTLRACAPVLPAAASAALLRSLLAGAGAGHAGAGAGTVGAGASAGKLALAGLGTKTLASAAVTITAGICIGGVVVTGALDHDHHRTGRHVARLSSAPAAGVTLGSGAASGAPVGLAAAAGSAPGWTPANTRLDSAPGGGSAGGGHGARGASSGPGQGRGLGAGARPASRGPGATRTGTGSGAPNGGANGTKTRAHGNRNGAANGTKTRAHGNGNGAANGTKTRAHGSGNGASKTPGNGSSKGAKTRSHGTGNSASTPATTQTGNSHAGGNGATGTGSTGRGKSGGSGSSHGNATSSTQSTRSASGTATAPSTTQDTTTNPGHSKK